MLPVIADGNTWPRLKKASASMLPDAKLSSASPKSPGSARFFGELTSAMFAEFSANEGKTSSDSALKACRPLFREWANVTNRQAPMGDASPQRAFGELGELWIE